MTFNTIGSLIAGLRTVEPNAPITIKGAPPCALMSYRGSYDELAISCGVSNSDKTELDERPDPFESRYLGHYHAGHGEVTIKANPTVGDLIEALLLAIGEEFEGYKGGQYLMRAGTPVWVSQYSECENRQIKRIVVSGDGVDLKTKKVEW